MTELRLVLTEAQREQLERMILRLEDHTALANIHRNAEHVQAQALTELVHRLEERVRVLEGTGLEAFRRIQYASNQEAERRIRALEARVKALTGYVEALEGQQWEDCTPDQQSLRPSGSEQPEKAFEGSRE